MLMTFISGAHLVINRAWALHHKLDQSELLTGTQSRHPDDSVEGLAKQAASPPEVRHTQGVFPIPSGDDVKSSASLAAKEERSGAESLSPRGIEEV